MQMKHLLIEGYCDGKKGHSVYPCKDTLEMGIHCLMCTQFSYVESPNEIAISESNGSIEEDSYIGFGDEMEPQDIKKREEYINSWKEICKKKINEAYDEYMHMIAVKD